MTSARDPRAELFSRHLPEGWALDDELAIFAVQSREKQKAVEHRLKILDAYLATASPSRGDVDGASAALGVGRRQFFNFLAKLRQFGPTRGLTPGFRNVARRSVASEGLSEPLETIVREMLAGNPGARISQVEAAVRAKCDEIDVPFPGESAIRRRVHALRRLLIPDTISGILGSQVITDQIYVDLTVKDGDKYLYAILTLIFDQQTKIILGHGLTPNYGDGEGLKLAVEDFRGRVPMLAESGFVIASSLDEVTVVVPRDLEPYSEFYLSSKSFVYGEPTLKIVDAGPRRHGAFILRHIGDRLPPFSFKPMAMERFEAASPDSDLPLDVARRFVRASVQRWNDVILSQSAHRAERPTRRRNSLDRIAANLAALFQPLHDVMEDFRRMFEEASHTDL